MRRFTPTVIEPQTNKKRELQTRPQRRRPRRRRKRKETEEKTLAPSRIGQPQQHALWLTPRRRRAIYRRRRTTTRYFSRRLFPVPATPPRFTGAVSGVLRMPKRFDELKAFGTLIVTSRLWLKTTADSTKPAPLLSPICGGRGAARSAIGTEPRRRFRSAIDALGATQLLIREESKGPRLVNED